MTSERLNFKQIDIKNELLASIKKINQSLKLISYKPIVIDNHFIVRMTERKLSHSIILEMLNKLEHRIGELLFCAQLSNSITIRYRMHLDYYLFLYFSERKFILKTCIKKEKNSIYKDAVIIDLN